MEFFWTLVQASLPGSPAVPPFPHLKLCNHSLICSIAKLTSVRYHAIRARKRARAHAADLAPTNTNTRDNLESGMRCVGISQQKYC